MEAKKRKGLNPSFLRTFLRSPWPLQRQTTCGFYRERSRPKTYGILTLVGFHVPAVVFLHLLAEFGPVNAVLLGSHAHTLIDTAFHALEPAHIGMGIGLLHEIPKLVGMLTNPVLNIHAAPLRVLLLAADGVGQSEVIGILLLDLLQLGKRDEDLQVLCRGYCRCRAPQTPTRPSP